MFVKQSKKNGLELVHLLQNITFQKDGSKHYIMELVESERNLIMCFHNNIIPLYHYKR